MFVLQLAEELQRECLAYAKATRSFCDIEWRTNSADSPTADELARGKALGATASACNAQLRQLRQLFASLDQLQTGDQRRSHYAELPELLRLVRPLKPRPGCL